MNSTVEKLLDQAESDIRLRGYHAVSFRDLAASLGIKSASVHYYFRQKEDLGIALVKRYSDTFFETLNDRAEKTGDPLGAFTGLYRDALTRTDRICLCGMLGAESCGLPAALGDEVKTFFRKNIDWVAEALSGGTGVKDPQATAEQIVAGLQGAMILANSLRDHTIFDRVAKGLHY